MPSSRDAIVHRLRGTQSAYKIYTGKPRAMLSDFLAGRMTVPKNEAELSPFAYALHDLPNDFEAISDVRSVVLQCLKRDNEAKNRTQIYRAACRVDEIMHHQLKLASK